MSGVFTEGNGGSGTGGGGTSTLGLVRMFTRGIVDRRREEARLSPIGLVTLLVYASAALSNRPWLSCCIGDYVMGGRRG